MNDKISAKERFFFMELFRCKLSAPLLTQKLRNVNKQTEQDCMSPNSRKSGFVI